MSATNVHDVGFSLTKFTPAFKKELKSYGFAIAIIVGIGGFAAGGVGLTAFFHVGSLSNVAQIDAIIMMAVGGGGGASLLVIGIFGTLKNRKTIHNSISNYHTTGIHGTPPIHFTKQIIIQNCQRFGKKEWELVFGVVGDEPEEPPHDIDRILNLPCPFFRDKTVKETHMLVLIPATVNGEDLTLDTLQKLIRNPRQGNQTDYRYYTASDIQKSHGNKKVDKSYWVLMTRDLIPGITFREDQDFILKKAKKGYVPPSLLEAAVCILTQFVASGECLYGKTPPKYLYCPEEDLFIGNFDASSLDFLDSKDMACMQENIGPFERRIALLKRMDQS